MKFFLWPLNLKLTEEVLPLVGHLVEIRDKYLLRLIILELEFVCMQAAESVSQICILI